MTLEVFLENFRFLWLLRELRLFAVMETFTVEVLRCSVDFV